MENQTTVKEHYENHLGHFYSWMTGDFRTRADEFKNFLIGNEIQTTEEKIAIDIGAGHGIQSIPLAEQGFKVLSIDFCQPLLDELQLNAKGLNISAIKDDIRKVSSFTEKPELIICCGDTLTHLNNKQEIETLINDIAQSLMDKGKTILSFRDYSTPLTGTSRFIPVKSDDSRILTCFLDYEREYVNVTDLLYEKTEEGWQQKVSTYKKVRLLAEDVIRFLSVNGLTIEYNQAIKGMITIIAVKRGKKQQS